MFQLKMWFTITEGRQKIYFSSSTAICDTHVRWETERQNMCRFNFKTHRFFVVQDSITTTITTTTKTTTTTATMTPIRNKAKVVHNKSWNLLVSFTELLITLYVVYLG